MQNKPFSVDLETWLKSKGPKTVGYLQEVFDEKSFAILFLLFMFIPALPVPTGGITNLILLPTVMVASLQMVFGRRSLWLPWFMKRIKLGDKTMKKALPFIVRRVRQLERFSRPRLSNLLEKAVPRTILGLTVFILALGSWISPPFSLLDTLPSMGGVLIALAIILEDAAFYIVGLVVGAVGIGLIVAAFDLVIAFVQKIF